MFVIISCLNWFFGLWLFQKSSCWWATSSLNVLLIYRYCIILTTYLFSNKLHLCAKVLSWSFHYFVQSWQWHCTCILQHLLFMRSPTRLGSTASGLWISWLPCHHLLFHLFSLVSWNKFCLVTGSLGKRHNSHPRASVLPWTVIYHKWCLPDKKISYLSPLHLPLWGWWSLKFTWAWRTCRQTNEKTMHLHFLNIY